jgi:glycosyltransferase involved in cell wall biosynthesis
MTIIHFVVDRFHPQQGGLEASALRVARLLRDMPETDVRVYVRSGEYAADAVADYADQTVDADIDISVSDGLAIVALGQKREPVEAPLVAGALFQQYDIAVARNWLDVMQVRDRIEACRRESPGARHVLLSFAVNHAGFVAQHVAIALDLPHVASIRGSDYAIAVQNPVFLSAFEWVVRQADVVVTTNDEQRRFVERTCSGGARARTIHNSAPASTLRRRWERPRRDDTRLRLVADCGYAFNKGTHVLMDAFERLAETHGDLSLTLVGRHTAERRSASYWTKRTRALVDRFGDRADLREHVPTAEVLPLLLESDIYCSATLGEGCSNARVAALTLGMPIVSTRCGELADVACDAPHVRLARPGDVDDFTRTLDAACADLRRDAMTIPRDRVAQWKRHFHGAREVDAWRWVLDRVVMERVA